MKIRSRVEGAAMAATLEDTETGRDFLSLPPLSVLLEDYASTEKIAVLPRKLSTAGAPAGSDARAGAIAYYAPSGNLALFYRDPEYANGLVRLGALDAGTSALSRPASLEPAGRTGG